MRRTINNALRILLLHRWAFFVPFCVAASAVFIGSLYYPRTYSATTTFERRDHPVASSFTDSEGSGSFTFFRSTLAQDLKSTDAMAEVADQLGLTAEFDRDADGELTDAGRRQRDARARSLGSSLSVSTHSPNRHRDQVSIRYEGPDPAIGKELVDQAKRTYIRRTQEWMANHLEEQQEYFAALADEADMRLRAAQREETQLHLDNPGVDPRDAGAITAKLAQLEIERRDLELRRRMLDAELSAARQLLATTGPRIANRKELVFRASDMPLGPKYDPEETALVQKIHEIDNEVDVNRTIHQMTDEHPLMKDLMRQRRRLEAKLQRRQHVADASATTNAPLGIGPPGFAVSSDPTIQQWEADRARLLVRIDTIAAQVQQINISLESNAAATDKTDMAKRSVFGKQEEYLTTAQARDEARRDLFSHRAKLATLEPALQRLADGRGVQFFEEHAATGGTKPISPRTPTIVLLAFLSGLALGVVSVIIAELFDHIYRSAGQVARNLGIPILDTVDEIVTGSDKRRMLLRKVLFAPAALACGFAVVSLTGSLAYLNIERPWTYNRIRDIPQSAVNLLLGDPGDTAESGTENP